MTWRDDDNWLDLVRSIVSRTTSSVEESYPEHVQFFKDTVETLNEASPEAKARFEVGRSYCYLSFYERSYKFDYYERLWARACNTSPSNTSSIEFFDVSLGMAVRKGNTYAKQDIEAIKEFILRNIEEGVRVADSRKNR